MAPVSGQPQQHVPGLHIIVQDALLACPCQPSQNALHGGPGHVITDAAVMPQVLQQAAITQVPYCVHSLLRLIVECLRHASHVEVPANG